MARVMPTLNNAERLDELVTAGMKMHRDAFIGHEDSITSGSRMVADTRKKLLNTALILFSENWYETVSVAEICRRAELSNGIFYKYFKNKEELFKEEDCLAKLILHGVFDDGTVPENPDPGP